jgi:hypothetical protein
MKKITIILILTLLQACVAYPKFTPDRDNKRCELVTKKLRLATEKDAYKVTAKIDPISAIISAGLLYGVTVVVSGSVVLVGNTVHFLEKQGQCDDSFLNTQLLDHLKPLLEQGGTVIEPKQPAASSDLG